jgi:hypothetical protein
MPTPLKAIRSHCLWCCNGSANEVSLCTAKACPLHSYRGWSPEPVLVRLTFGGCLTPGPVPIVCLVPLIDMTMAPELALLTDQRQTAGGHCWSLP